MRTMYVFSITVINEPFLLRSGLIPNSTHHKERGDSRLSLIEANGGLLSVRIAKGKPNLRETRSKTGRT